MRGLGFGIFAVSLIATPVLAQTAPAAAHQHATSENQLQSVANRYVEDATVPGIVIAVGHRGQAPKYVSNGRIRASEQSLPADPDSLWRVYSMTKPITGIAAMILVDDGKLQLDQPISDFIPAFRDMKVLVDPAKGLESRAAVRQITVRHLLTHTAGLGYSIITKGPLLDEYNRLGLVPAQVSRLLERAARPARPTSLMEFANRVASVPLIADPGATWSYSISLDVLAAVVEAASGQPFEQFVSTRIFTPLGMRDTYWQVPAAQAERLSDNFANVGGTRVVMDPGATSVYLDAPSFPYGGAGLVMSTRDYDRFLHMLLNEGELDGARILRPDTTRLAMSDLLPAGVDLSMLKIMAGDAGVTLGHGAGGTVYLTDSALGPRKGTFGWGGAAGTTGWVDPASNMRVTAMLNRFELNALRADVAKAIFSKAEQ